MRHKAKILTKQEVESGRSNAYKYLNVTMKAKLILLENPIIIVDEKPKSNDAVYVNNDIYSHEIRNFTRAYGDENLNDCIKIIALHGDYKYTHHLPLIDFNGLEEEFGLYDPYRLAIEELESRHTTVNDVTFRLGFETGFKKAQSLNDKKFSLDEIKQLLFDFGDELFNNCQDGITNEYLEKLEVKYIRSLQQPKIFDIEIEMELDEDLALEQIQSENPEFMTSAYVPKITDNKIKIIKKL